MGAIKPGRLWKPNADAWQVVEFPTRDKSRCCDDPNWFLFNVQRIGASLWSTREIGNKATAARGSINAGEVVAFEAQFSTAFRRCRAQAVARISSGGVLLSRRCTAPGARLPLPFDPLRPLFTRRRGRLQEPNICISVQWSHLPIFCHDLFSLLLED